MANRTFASIVVKSFCRDLYTFVFSCYDDFNLTYWESGDKVIILNQYVDIENDALKNAYLEKYPVTEVGNETCTDSDGYDSDCCYNDGEISSVTGQTVCKPKIMDLTASNDLNYYLNNIL